MYYKKISLLIGSSILIVILLLAALSKVKFGFALSPMERDILLFSYNKVKITERKPSMVTNLISPIEVATAPKSGYPKVPLSELAPGQKEMEQRVSLILIKEGKKIAVINNLVVKEGDTINLGRVARIDRGGVLIRNKEGEQWLKID